MAARDLDVTRVVRLGLLTDREEATNSCTRVGVLRSKWTNLRSIFNGHQSELAFVLGRERRPGVMMFLLTATDVEGWCWLAAKEDLRAGTLGRHGCVDLHVPREAGLSLRHCLVLVRRAGEGVLTHVVDLSSTGGIRLEDQQPVRAVAADGPFFLHAPGAVIAFFPTGGPLPWNPEAMPAFDSLPPRRISNLRERAPVLQRPLAAPESSVTVVSGPVALEAATLLEDGEVPAGELVLTSKEGREKLLVGLSALGKGVVIGRYDRCAGGSALVNQGISRVHSLLIRRDERLYLADAGSTNGTWLGEEEIKCARLRERTDYLLGTYAALSWTAYD